MHALNLVRMYHAFVSKSGPMWTIRTVIPTWLYNQISDWIHNTADRIERTSWQGKLHPGNNHSIKHDDVIKWNNFPRVLVLWVGDSPVTGEFPAQRPVTQSFDVFFDLHLNKRLSKQTKRRWFETQSCPLWRHCNEARHIPWDPIRHVSWSFPNSSMLLFLHLQCVCYCHESVCWGKCGYGFKSKLSGEAWRLLFPSTSSMSLRLRFNLKYNCKGYQNVISRVCCAI